MCVNVCVRVNVCVCVCGRVSPAGVIVSQGDTAAVVETRRQAARAPLPPALRPGRPVWADTAQALHPESKQTHLGSADANGWDTHTHTQGWILSQRATFSPGRLDSFTLPVGYCC